MEKKSIKFGILGGALEVIYVVIIASFFWLAERIFIEPGMFNVVVILLIFVLSAAISGILVFGYPAYLFLKKKYKEAILTVLLSLFVILGLLFIGIVFYLLIY